MASCAAAASAASTPGREARDEVREYLDNFLRVVLMDGRVLVGKFSCFDKQRNVLLNDATELRFLGAETRGKPDYERQLGIVLVPWKYIKDAHAILEDIS